LSTPSLLCVGARASAALACLFGPDFLST